MRRDRIAVLRWLVGLLTFGLTVLAFADGLAVSAKVDKTSVDAGEPITLVITLSGDLAGAELAPLDLPDGFVVGARSHATSVAIRAGAMERSTSVTYVLVAQERGTFQLGPFRVELEQQTYETEPIDITVENPAVPPSLKDAPGERFTL
jgi:uncharacterized protein (DUF58 family)